jgi:hypothetical protein
MYGPEIRHSDLHRLGHILESAQSDHPWQLNELGVVLQHQLESPLEFGTASSENSTTVAYVPQVSQGNGATAGPGLGTVGDLLRDPHPPLPMLEKLKDFAKTHAVDPLQVIPQEIAALLYYAAIIAAWLRCDCRITELDSESLRLGLGRLLECTWLDEMTRKLFEEGLCKVSDAAAAHKSRPH